MSIICTQTRQKSDICLKEVLIRTNAVGYYFQRGIEDDDDEDEDEDEEEDDEEEEEEDKKKTEKKERVFTEEEVAQLRYIVLTKRREHLMESMDKALLRDQYGDSVMMFNTSFSYDVLSLVPKELKKIASMKKIGEAFDRLLCLTHSISSYDAWLFDYEDREGMERMLKSLGSQWKKFLVKTDEELEIDPEFTRPAIIDMLESFQEQCNSANFHVRFVN